MLKELNIYIPINFQAHTEETSATRVPTKKENKDGRGLFELYWGLHVKVPNCIYSEN